MTFSRRSVRSELPYSYIRTSAERCEVRALREEVSGEVLWCGAGRSLSAVGVRVEGYAQDGGGRRLVRLERAGGLRWAVQYLRFVGLVSWLASWLRGRALLLVLSLSTD